jgi:hypothetical protein
MDGRRSSWWQLLWGHISPSSSLVLWVQCLQFKEKTESYLWHHLKTIIGCLSTILVEKSIKNIHSQTYSNVQSISWVYMKWENIITERKFDIIKEGYIKMLRKV